MLEVIPGASEGAVAEVAYEVTAIRYATLRAPRSQLFHRYESYGEADAEVEMAYFFWLLSANGETILVDTGFDPDVGRRRGRTCLVEPLDAIRGLGIEPEDIRTVVVTHFHYDHIGNLSAFPGAELIVPRREFEFWTGPLAARSQFSQHVEAAEVEFIERAHAEGRVRMTEGVETILPGVEAISVGGHSPGQQLTMISTDEGQVLLASDAVHFYEELERDRPFGVIADLADMYRAYDRIRKLSADATVVPGHDPEVLARFSTSKGVGSGAAVRLDSDERGED